MRNEYDVSGRGALVTGAGRRLGRALALALADAGANLAIHYGRSREPAEETARLAIEKGVRAVTLQADLAKADEARSLLSRAEDRLGAIDLLINSAAIFEPPGFLETDLATWERHLAINLRAPFLLSQAFAAARRGRPSAILNLLDWRALRPGADHFAYSISKAGLAAMTHSMAIALAPGIRVNGLALGAILPPPGAEEKDPAIVRDVPAGRWGTVEEVTQAALFLLAGPDFITGEILLLDGGRHLV